MINKQKGTYDLIKDEARKVLTLNNIFEEIMDKYNYEFIRTPLIEASELFHRGVGETTDIVTKETYDFKDRGDRAITLRPEGTAGVVRALIENKMYVDQVLPKKFWYYGPMYRYERPQSGRYREHYQFGCEAFGSDDPMMDAEIISIPVTLFRLLGLKGIKVNINSLGDKESREAYHDALINYFKGNIDELCDDCKTRFEKNPLRILDCKVDCDKDIIKNAPKTINYLNKESKEFFDQVCNYLKALEINYTINPNTVRGLDYYTHTVFEVEAEVEGFGSQNVLCAGGRYDNLVKNLDGPSIPAVGFGMGSERLLMALDYEKISLIPESSIDVYIAPVSGNEKPFALALANSLRILGFKTELDYLSRKIKNNFEASDRLNSLFTIVIGEEEIKENRLTVKNMLTKEEEKVDNVAIINYLYEAIDEIRNKEHEHSCDCGCEDECDCDDDCNCGDNCHCHDKE